MNMTNSSNKLYFFNLKKTFNEWRTFGLKHFFQRPLQKLLCFAFLRFCVQERKEKGLNRNEIIKPFVLHFCVKQYICGTHLI